MATNSSKLAGLNSLFVRGLCALAIGIVVAAWWWPSRQNVRSPIQDFAVATQQADANQAGGSTPTMTSVIQSNRKKKTQDLFVAELMSKIDAGRDGWTTEVLSDAALSQLEQLANYLKTASTNDEQLESLLDESFVCHALSAIDSRREFSDRMISVRRMDDGQLGDDQVYRGPAGFATALSQLVEFMQPIEHPYAKFKIVQVDLKESELTTHVYVEISDRAESISSQLTAQWICDWSVPRGDDELPRLRKIRTLAHEQVVAKAPSGALFVDCTEAALGSNESYRQHVLTGYDHWVTRISRLEMMRYMGLHGVSVADTNGDGLEDIYMCDVGGLPNRLFVQAADGTFVDRSDDSGLNWLEYTTSALFVDLDNDGDQDAVLATRPFLLILENDGFGRFKKVFAKQVVTDAYNICAADFDNDRDLDLYICGYLPDEVGQLASPVPYHDANNGGRNTLLRNESEFKFEDVTESVGLNENNTRFSYAAVWEDFNDDGQLDIYVANDFGRNNLYLWKDNRFTDVAKTAGVEDTASGMSVCTGDYNGDGTIDIYIGNMFSSAGNRIAFQSKFSAGRANLPLEDLQRMARGNTLLANNGDGTFRDETLEAGVNMGRWSWGSKFTDLNNDGWLDLVVTNGFITAAETGDL